MAAFTISVLNLTSHSGISAMLCLIYLKAVGFSFYNPRKQILSGTILCFEAYRNKTILAGVYLPDQGINVGGDSSFYVRRVIYVSFDVFMDASSSPRSFYSVLNHQCSCCQEHNVASCFSQAQEPRGQERQLQEDIL